MLDPLHLNIWDHISGKKSSSTTKLNLTNDNLTAILPSSGKEASQKLIMNVVNDNIEAINSIIAADKYASTQK